jgi:riboflavin synthase alpha subunit
MFASSTGIRTATVAHDTNIINRDHYTTTTCHVVYGSSNACLPACLTIKRISNREEEVAEVEEGEVEVEEEQEGAGGLGRGGGG